MFTNQFGPNLNTVVDLYIYITHFGPHIIAYLRKKLIKFLLNETSLTSLAIEGVSSHFQFL